MRQRDRFGGAATASSQHGSSAEIATATAIAETPVAPARLPRSGNLYGAGMVWFALMGAGTTLFGFALLKRRS